MIRALAVFAVAWVTAGGSPCAAQWVPPLPGVRAGTDLWLQTETPTVRRPGPQSWPPSSVGPEHAARLFHGRIAVVQLPPDRWLAPDKLKHFFLSFGTTGFAFAGARAGGAGDRAEWFAAAAAMGAGLGKEVADQRHGWGFSLRDLVWDTAGVLAALAVLRRTG